MFSIDRGALEWSNQEARVKPYVGNNFLNEQPGKDNRALCGTLRFRGVNPVGQVHTYMVGVSNLKELLLHWSEQEFDEKDATIVYLVGAVLQGHVALAAVSSLWSTFRCRSIRRYGHVL